MQSISKLVFFFFVGSFPTAPPLPDAPLEPFHAKLDAGELHLLSYNVAGLLDGISGSSPERNTPIISGLLDSYDLVMVQEDFCYHEALVGSTGHGHKSKPEHDPGCTILFGPSSDLGDGLNRMSRSDQFGYQRYDWESCHGTISCDSDCMANKGFSVATHHVALGVEIDVYNVHLDAGLCEGDLAARRAQIGQIMAEIARRSRHRAVIIAGDFNFERTVGDRKLARDLRRVGFRDACSVTRCGEELLDRVFYRSSREVALGAIAWDTPAEFVDPEGEALSDHAPIAARLLWAVR